MHRISLVYPQFCALISIAYYPLSINSFNLSLVQTSLSIIALQISTANIDFLAPGQPITKTLLSLVFRRAIIAAYISPLYLPKLSYSLKAGKSLTILRQYLLLNFLKSTIYFYQCLVRESYLSVLSSIITIYSTFVVIS